MKALARTFVKEVILIGIFVSVLFAMFVQVMTPTGAISKDQAFAYQQLADGNYQIVAYLQYDKQVSLPEQYQKQAVTAVADEAFLGSSELVEVEMHSNIVYFGKNAFSGCTSLQRILVPQGQAEVFANRLSESVFGKVTKPIALYETNHVAVMDNGEPIDMQALSNEIYFTSRLVGEIIDIEITLLWKPMYVWSQQDWQSDVGNAMEDVHEQADIVWFYEDVSGAIQQIGTGSALHIEALQENAAGKYIAKQKEDVLFQMQLNVIGDTGSDRGIYTGTLSMQSFLLLISVSLCIIVILLFKKQDKSRKEWR